MARKKVVLLDIDGTLVDSNDAHARSWVEALEHFGHEVPFPRVRERIGKGGDKLLFEAAGLPIDSEEGRAVAKWRLERFRSHHLPQLHAFPRAAALVRAFGAIPLRRLAATSATGEELGNLLRVARIEELVEVGATADDVDRSKPDPDIVVAALERAGCSAREAIMLGDTPYDVEAAQKAGVDIVALRCGGWADADLRGAVAIYEDPAELFSNLAASPFMA
jgi:phosphoglycolate phosphatase-like HAD superfamily hydrolase